MSDDFNYESLGAAYQNIKTHGMNMQLSGAELVKIAESGLANIPAVQVLDMTCLNLVGSNPRLQAVRSNLIESGVHTLAKLTAADTSAKFAFPSYESVIAQARAAVTYSNIGTTSSVEMLCMTDPVAGAEFLNAWPPNGLVRSFTDEQLDVLLAGFDDSLPRRRKGAWQTFHSPSEEAASQASHTMRDILAKVIAKEATNAHVEGCDWYRSRKTTNPATKPTIKDRIQFLLYGSKNEMFDPAELTEIEQWVSQYVSDDGALKELAHGSSAHSQAAAKLSMQKIEELLYYVLVQRRRPQL